MKTVKPTETKSITARELFSLTHSTREMFSDEKIESMKKKVIEMVKSRKTSVEFFENDGVVFYCSTFSEKGHKFTTINDLKDYSIMSGSDLWKFGFVNKKTGEITLLFGGYFIANNRKEAFKYFEIAKVVATKKYADKEELVTFAMKD